MTETAIERLISAYPQLLLNIYKGASASDEYKDAVLKGLAPKVQSSPFLNSPDDRLFTEKTPAGDALIAYIVNRSDFERVLQALAYRCEPVTIAPNTGAMTILGLINHSKIKQHRLKYLFSGKKDWDEEYKRFVAVPENFKDTLIVLSCGNYSGISGPEAGYDSCDWLDKSFTIREYHELTHFVSRRLFPENKNAVRDEIIADCIGLIAATGEYRPQAARRFLGIENNGTDCNGRLQNYVKGDELAKAVISANRMIDLIYETYQKKALPVFDFLTFLEKDKTGLSIFAN